MRTATRHPPALSAGASSKGRDGEGRGAAAASFGRLVSDCLNGPVLNAWHPRQSFKRKAVV